jgi:RimJ/RimL family protein N-acetyltransferase
MPDLWRQIISNYREGGLRLIFRKAVWRLGQWIRSEQVWLVYRVDASRFHRQPELPLRHARMDSESLREVRYFKILSAPEIVRQRFESGAVCNGFFVDGELANVGWTTAGYLEIEPGICIDDPDCGGIYDCYTLPAQRGKGVYGDSLIRMINALGAEGARTVLISVDPHNVPSIKAIEKAGFIPFYELAVSCRLGRRSRTESAFQPRFGRG